MIGPEQPQRGRMPRPVKQATFALYGQVLICAATLYGLLSRAVEALAPVLAGCAGAEPADCLAPEDDTLSG